MAPYSSLELNMFELDRSHPVLYAVIYCPPKYKKDFIDVFFTVVRPKYERVQIGVDFNIDICCLSGRLLKFYYLVQFAWVLHRRKETH